MKAKHILWGALALVVLAGCPDGSGDSGGPGEEPEYRVSVAELSGGSIRIKPESGPEGTEILVQVNTEEGWAYIPGSLAWDGGTGPVPIDEALLRFTLPAADVTVAASFLNGEELGRRMVRVEGKTVTTSIGNGPFANAGTAGVPVQSFKIGAAEITYDLWYTVTQWAESSEREPDEKYTINHGYGFGTEGSAIVNANQPPTEHRYEPVYQITWGNAIAWCNAYSEWDHEVNGAPYEPVYKKNGQVVRSYSITPDEPAPDARGYRLPTEAEWEFAARGGGPAAPAWDYRYAGGNNPNDVAWYNANSGGKTQTVGLKAPNTLGLYDMSGNAAEWCWEQVRRGGAYDDSALIISRSSGARYIDGTLRVVVPAD